MKKIITTFLGMFFILATSCTNFNEPVQEPVRNENESPKTTSPTYVSLESALKKAQQMMDLISNGKTRSIRKIKSVQYVGGRVATRSNPSDTLFYLVNYENEGGFALLSSDNRTAPVFAISDEGHLDLSDTLNIEGLRIFYNNACASIYSLPSFPPIDTTVTVKPDFPGPEIDVTIETTKVSPLLASYVRNGWHQHSPFNQRLAGRPAGCTAVAAGMVMSYFEYPSSYNNFTFNWNQMKQGNNDLQVSNLFYLLGLPQNLNMTYGSLESWADVSNYNQTFYNFGYNFGGISSFSSVTAFGILNSESKFPLLVWGGLYNSSGPGHAWVIDGGIYTYEEGSHLIEPYPKKTYLFHCVWGWGGDGYQDPGICNGYFNFDRYGYFGGYPEKTDSDDDGSSTGNARFINIKYAERIYIR